MYPSEQRGIAYSSACLPKYKYRHMGCVVMMHSKEEQNTWRWEQKKSGYIIDTMYSQRTNAMNLVFQFEFNYEILQKNTKNINYYRIVSVNWA